MPETYTPPSIARHHETEVSREAMPYRELALRLVEAFGNQHMTQARRAATELILDLPTEADRAEQDAFVAQFLQQRDYQRPCSDVIAGIVEDYRLLQSVFGDYVTSYRDNRLDERQTGPCISEVMQLDDAETIPRGVWTKPEPELFPAPDLARMIRTFSTKGSQAEGIGLETAMIAGSLALADLMTTPYQHAGAYKKAVYAKNFLAPICSIIGMDALESALNDEIDIIAGRNIGDSLDNSRMSKEIDALLDETDRMVSLHFGRKHSSDPKRFEFAKGNQASIIRDLVGEVELESAVRLDAPHSMFFHVGTVTTPEGDLLSVRSRGKGRGSYVRKVIRNLGYYDRVIDAHRNAEPGDIHPIDLYGSTIIAQDNDQLARMYARAVERAVCSEKIMPYPSPGRHKAVFIVKGPQAFQDAIREKVLAQAPDIDEELFDIRTYDSGFVDAKITGLYETGDPRAGFAPFEMQFSTPPARLVARIDGRAAHFIFKLRKVFGDAITKLDDASLEAVADIWHRKQDYFNNVDEEAKERHLTSQGRERVEALWRRIAQRQQATDRLAAQALK